MSGWVWTPKPDTPLQDSLCLKKPLFNKLQTVWEHSELQKEIEMPVLLAHAIEDSTDIFGISGVLNTLNPPLGTPLVLARVKSFMNELQPDTCKQK